MSFPDDLPAPHHRHHPDQTHPSNQAAPPQPPTATLSAFDSSLSTKTRVKALMASLTINLFLPFVNGVMLGFGEIFAKNVILGWLGWSNSAPATAQVGLRRSKETGR
jgi:hypothetical protein